MKYKPEVREQSETYLKSILPPGSTVYSVLRHTTRSGLTRYIDLYAIAENRLVKITYSVAAVIGAVYSVTNEAIKIDGYVSGAGSDCVIPLGYHLHGVPKQKEMPSLFCTDL